MAPVVCHKGIPASLIEKDIGRAMTKFVAEDTITSFGFYADINSQSELEQHWLEYFKNHQSMVQSEQHYTVYVYGDAACLWLTHKLESSGEPEKPLTLFLEKHHGDWLIRHRHHSYAPVCTLIILNSLARIFHKLPRISRRTLSL